MKCYRGRLSAHMALDTSSHPCNCMLLLWPKKWNAFPHSLESELACDLLWPRESSTSDTTWLLGLHLSSLAYLLSSSGMKPPCKVWLHYWITRPCGKRISPTATEALDMNEDTLDILAPAKLPAECNHMTDPAHPKRSGTVVLSPIQRIWINCCLRSLVLGWIVI